jgi:hypothetical protein
LFCVMSIACCDTAIYSIVKLPIRSRKSLYYSDKVED